MPRTSPTMRRAQSSVRSPSLRGERYKTRATLDEHHAKDFLELFEACRHCRLRDAASFGGAAEVPFFCQSQQEFEFFDQEARLRQTKRRKELRGLCCFASLAGRTPANPLGSEIMQNCAGTRRTRPDLLCQQSTACAVSPGIRATKNSV